MTAEQRAAARRRVEAMSTSLADLSTQRDRLLDRRRQLFAQLVDDGVTQAELARWAGVTQQAVALVVRKART